MMKVIFVLSIFTLVLTSKIWCKQGHMQKSWLDGQCGKLIPISVNPKSPVSLKCPATVKPPYTFYRRHSQLLSNTTNPRFILDNDTLNITSFRVTDGGIYKCVGQNTGSCYAVNWIVQADPCSYKKCYNGGKCKAVGLKYQCTCPSSYVGRRCKTKVRTRVKAVGSSVTLTCKQLGEKDSTYLMMAKNLDDYTKPGTQVNITANKKAPNRFTLTNLSYDDTGYYFCNNEKTTGKNVIREIWNLKIVKDMCNPTSCLNGATCVLKGTSFKCRCAKGYKGKLCQNKAVFPSLKSGGN